MTELFVCDEHHHVLEAWEKYPGNNVITLDYHTDTHPAFQHYSYGKHKDIQNRENLVQNMLSEQSLLVNNYRSGKKSLNECINLLRNDEHIDFAVQAGIVNSVFVIPSGGDGNNGFVNKRIFDARHQHTYNAHPIIEYNYICLPNCKRGPHNDDCLIDLAANLIDDIFLNDAVSYVETLLPSFFHNYILDIDLDYFRSITAFQSTQLFVFKSIAQHANLLTIAKEEACLEMHKLEGDLITADVALGNIKRILNL